MEKQATFNFKNVMVYHHDDLDGYAAAAAVYHGIKESYPDDVKIDFKAIGFPTTWETFAYNTDPAMYDEIYIVDYSFTNATIQHLLKLAESSHVNWIDHHASSGTAVDVLMLDDVATDNIRYCVDFTHSGAWLAWVYTHSTSVPEMIKLVDDHDRWVHSDPRSELVNDAFFASNELHDPSSIEWLRLLENSSDTNNYIIQLVSEGTTIAKYREMLYKQHRRFAFKVKIKDFEQYSAIALNDYGNSKCFGDLVKQYDICVLFHTPRPGEVAMSLYCDPEILAAKDINVSKIAIKYGGGGHPGAAGCSMSQEQFNEVFIPVE